MYTRKDAHTTLPLRLVGDDISVTCVDGEARVAIGLDNAASTSALPAVAARVAEFLPRYSSVHRGAGAKSRASTEAYEAARVAALSFAGRVGPDDVAIVCRNTTEAINHLAYRLRLSRDEVVATTVVEHHSNLLPWGRVAQRRYVECGQNGTFGLDDVAAALEERPRPRLLAVTGASNVTGWLPPLEAIIGLAHHHGVPVFVDAAQLAPHRALPPDADFVAWSGHKMYAPFGSGILIGPRDAFTEGDPFLAGGGAVDAVDLDEVAWTEPPEREEAGSPNVVGAVALHAALDEIEALGWPAISAHEASLAERLRFGLTSIPGVHLLGPPLEQPTLAVASFVVDVVHHALVAARLSAEFGIATRHGCFCAHPYLFRLLGLGHDDVLAHREAVRKGDRRNVPGAVRASASLATTESDIDSLVEAVGVIASGQQPAVTYEQDARTGDFEPVASAGWDAAVPGLEAACSRG